MEYFFESINQALKVVVDAILQAARLSEMIPSVSGIDILWIWIIVLPNVWGLWGFVADAIIIAIVGYKVINWIYRITTTTKHFFGIYD